MLSNIFCNNCHNLLIFAFFLLNYRKKTLKIKCPCGSPVIYDKSDRYPSMAPLSANGFKSVHHSAGTHLASWGPLAYNRCVSACESVLNFFAILKSTRFSADCEKWTVSGGGLHVVLYVCFLLLSHIVASRTRDCVCVHFLNCIVSPALHCGLNNLFYIFLL